MYFYSNQYLNFALYQYEALGTESQALAVKPQAYEVVTRVRHSTAVRRLASARETSARRLLALHYKRHFSVMRPVELRDCLPKPRMFLLVFTPSAKHTTEQTEKNKIVSFQPHYYVNKSKSTRLDTLEQSSDLAVLLWTDLANGSARMTGVGGGLVGWEVGGGGGLRKK